MSPRTVLASAIAAFVISAATISFAQVQRTGPINVAGARVIEPSSLADRISHLEQQNSQLAGQVAQLQQQLNQAKATDEKEFFADRLRLTALEASTAQHNQNFDEKLSQLSGNYAAHTHTYGQTTFGWWGGQMHDLKMAQPTATSGPN